MNEKPEIIGPSELAVVLSASSVRPWMRELFSDLGARIIHGGASVQFAESDVSVKGGQDQESGVPTFYFYEDVDSYRIAGPDREIRLNKSKGLSMIHFLLQDPNPDLPYPSKAVHHLGQVPVTDGQPGDYYQCFKMGKPHDLALSKKDRMIVKDSIDDLVIRIEEHDYRDPLQKEEDEEKLDKLRTIYRQRRLRATGSDENARTSTQKAISRALDRINEYYPGMERYLNNSTIVTGGSCCYRPLAHDPVNWVLSTK